MANSAGRGEGSSKERLVVVLFVVLLVAACVPVWVFRFAPLVDYPLHVARAYLLSLPQDGQGITEFYQAKWQAIPNLGMDIVVSQLMRFMPPLVAAKAFLTLLIVGLATGGFAFSAALNKQVTAAALFPLLALFDEWFWMGFANYLFGLGLALWIAAAWHWTAHWKPGKRAVLLAPLLAALAVCHLMSFAVCIGLVALTSLPQRIHRRTWWAAAAGLAVCGVAFVGLTALHRTPIAWEGRLETMASLFFLGQSGSPAFAVLLVCVACGLVPLLEEAKPALAFLGVTALLGPSFLGGTAFACDRLTLPFLIVLLASVRLEKRRRIGTDLCFLACGLLLFLFRLGPLASRWLKGANEAAAIVAALRAVPDGATLATFRIGPDPRPTWKDQRHLPDWILIERPVFVAQNFAKRRQQPMEIRPDFEPWHEFQQNNPVSVKDWNEFASLLPKLRSLQSRIPEGPNRGLYALVRFEHKARVEPPPGTRTVSLSDEHALLELDPPGR